MSRYQEDGSEDSVEVEFIVEDEEFFEEGEKGGKRDYASSSSSSMPHSKEEQQRASTRSSARKLRLLKDAAAKKEKIARETAEERIMRLQCKKEINRRYFDKETPEQRSARLARKSARERRTRLDNQLQCFHPDHLASVGIDVVHCSSGDVEMRVPWPVPPDETEEETQARYDYQEQVIKDLIGSETKEMTKYRHEKYRSMYSLVKRPVRPESEEARQRRLERAKEQTRIRRQNETPEQRVNRLEEQRRRTQRNRERKSLEEELRGRASNSSSVVRNTVGKRKAPTQPSAVREEVVVEEEIEYGNADDQVIMEEVVEECHDYEEVVGDEIIHIEYVDC